MTKPAAPCRPTRKRTVLRRLTTAAFLLVSVALVGVGGALLVRSGGTKSYRVHMLIDLDPNRALLAKRIATEAKRHGLTVELSSRPYGALESLDLVDLPNPIDVALVPGGVAGRDYTQVRQVASLTLEPLHLLVRGLLVEGGLAKLRGRRVNLGPATTADHSLARDVLSFAGLHAPADGGPGDYVVETHSAQELGGRLARLQGLSGAERQKAVDELPDAVFLLSALPSILAKDLVAVADYRLVPLPFADAYCLDRITPSHAGNVRIDRAGFSPMVIPAYTYGVDPAVPAAPCRTIATRLLLVAYAPTDAEAVARLLDTVFDGPVAGLAEPLPLKGQIPQFTFHDGTERFMRRKEPVLTPELVGTLAKAGGGLGALISGGIAFYGFLRLRQLRRFESYFQQIRHIELIARGLEADPHAPKDPAALRCCLEDRLLDLKSRALHDFAEGGLRGEGLIAGIIALVNDTRTTLAKLAPADGYAHAEKTYPMNSLEGRTVAVAEGRQLEDLAAMLEKEGATVLRCPMVSILDAPDPVPVLEWLRELIADRFGLVVLMTGEALRRLLGFADREGMRAEVLAALGRTRTLTRGPKPVQALREVGLTPGKIAEAPTTEGVITTLRQEPLAGVTVGVTLYGEANPTLERFVTEAGAVVRTVMPYVYAPAADAERVVELIRRLSRGEVDALVFTSSPQVDRLYEVAEKNHLPEELRQGMERVRVAAVGPVVAETLRQRGAKVDVCPEQGFVMKKLVQELKRAL